MLMPSWAQESMTQPPTTSRPEFLLGDISFLRAIHDLASMCLLAQRPSGVPLSFTTLATKDLFLGSSVLEPYSGTV